jgi:hypothetical protein
MSVKQKVEDHFNWSNILVVSDDPVRFNVRLMRMRGCRPVPDFTTERYVACGDYRCEEVPGTKYAKWEGMHLHEGADYLVSRAKAVLVYKDSNRGPSWLHKVVIRNSVSTTEAIRIISGLIKSK